MRSQKVIFLLLVLAIFLTIALTAGVGYASVTDARCNNIHFSPDQANFRVEFDKRPVISGEGRADIKYIDVENIVMDITGLKSVGDALTATFTITNKSEDVYADIYKTVTNSNKKYFKVTATLLQDTIAPNNGSTKLNFTVELIKLPIDKQEITNISLKVVATPSYCK